MQIKYVTTQTKDVELEGPSSILDPSTFECERMDVSAAMHRHPFARYADLGLINAIRGQKRPYAFVSGSEQHGWEIAIGAGLSRNQNKAFVIFHGQNWWSKRSRYLAHAAKRLIDVHVLCLSESMRKVVVEHYGFASEKVHNTGWGVDTDYFHPASGDIDNFILSAGSASRDYATLAKACTAIDAEVVVAANSSWHTETMNMDVRHAPPNMRFLNIKTYRELKPLYEKCQFVVVPLIEANYACGYAVIVEAMAMGKAVISTKIEGRSDLLLDQVTGLYVPVGDTDALATAAKELLADPARAKEMGRLGRERIVETSGLQAYADRVKAVIGAATARDSRM